MRRITGAIVALFISAAMTQVVHTEAASADGRDVRTFARHTGIGQPPYSVGTRPLLVIAMRFAGADTEHASGGGWVDSFDRDAIARRFFGASSSSVNGYMATASRGAFAYTPAAEDNGVANDGIVEVASDQSFDSYPTLWGRAIAAMQAADSGVSFSSYDTDGDGQLEGTELTLAVVSIGGARDAGEADSIQRSGAYLTIDGVSLAPNFWAAEVTPYTNFMTTVHELFHATFATVDEYGWGVGQLSVMGPTAGIPDSARFLPSAVTRFQLGWLTPAVATTDGAVELHRGEAAIVADPEGATSRYFMVEYRMQDGLDANASGAGVVVWRVDNAVNAASNGFNRGVELITPATLATDRRTDPCASGEHAMCHSGDRSDVFAMGASVLVPLRYADASSAYSNGSYAGAWLSDITSTPGGVRVSVHYGDLPSAPRPTVTRSASGTVASTSTTMASAAATVWPRAEGITPAPLGASAAAAESLLDELCSPQVFDCASH